MRIVAAVCATNVIAACAAAPDGETSDAAAMGFLPEAHTDFVVSFDCAASADQAGDCAGSPRPLSDYRDWVLCADGRELDYERGRVPEADALIAQAVTPADEPWDPPTIDAPLMSEAVALYCERHAP